MKTPVRPQGGLTPWQFAMAFGLALVAGATIVCVMAVVHLRDGEHRQVAENLARIVVYVSRLASQTAAADLPHPSDLPGPGAIRVVAIPADRLPGFIPQGFAPEEWQAVIAAAAARPIEADVWLAGAETVSRSGDASPVLPDPMPMVTAGRWLAVSNLAISRDGRAIAVVALTARDTAMRHADRLREYALAIWAIGVVLIGTATVILARTLEQRMAAEDLASRTASQIRLREADFIAAQSLARFGSWRWERQTGRLTVSDEYLQIMEVSRDHMPPTAEGWVEQFLVSSEDAQQAMLEFEAACNERRGYDGLRAIRTGTGRFKWIHFRAEPICDRVGALTGFRGVMRDVTEEENARRELLRGAAELRDAQRIANISHWSWDKETGRIALSDSFAKLLGVSIDALPKTAQEWFDQFGEEPQEGAADLRALVSRGLPYERERAITTAGGERRWIRALGQPVHDAQGRMTGYRGVIRDITDERAARARLAESEAHFRLISELSLDVVSILSPRLKVQYLSPSAQRLLGISIDRSIGQSPVAWIHPDDRTRVLAALDDLLHRAGSNRPLQFRFRDRDGNYHWVESSFVLAYHENGRVRHLQATTRDITDRKLAEIALAARTDELSQTNRRLTDEIAKRQELERNMLMAIERELARVGLELHDDLGQDLTGIALLVKTLERRLADGGSAANRNTAHDAARIYELVNRAINHTRMISHGLSPQVWGEAGLASSLLQLAEDIDSLGIVSCVARVRTELSIADEMVSRNLYRIAQEAVNNALRHGQALQIRISLKKVGNRIQLMIANDGRAMDTTALAEGGLHSIRHRARAIGAQVTIRHSTARGAAVRVTLVYWPAMPDHPVQRSVLYPGHHHNVEVSA